MAPRVYINAPYHEGANSSMGYYAVQLATALRDRSYEVVFCSIRPAALGSRQIALPSRLITRVGRINMVLLYARMIADIRRAGGSFAVLNISHEFILPAFLNRSLIIIHDTIQMEYPRSRGVKLLLRASWLLARRAAVTICDSRATQADLLALRICSEVVYVPFQTEKFASHALASAHGGALKLDAVWCGTLAVHKNFPLFIELCRRNPESRFGAVLPGREAATIAGQAYPPNLSIFSGLNERDYLGLLANARMCVSTSLKEGYGMPAMEALMLGTPVLLSDIPVYRELYGRVATFFVLSPDAIDVAFKGALAGRTMPEISHASPADLAPSQGRIEQFMEPIGRLFTGPFG